MKWWIYTQHNIYRLTVESTNTSSQPCLRSACWLLCGCKSEWMRYILYIDTGIILLTMLTGPLVYVLRGNFDEHTLVKNMNWHFFKIFALFNVFATFLWWNFAYYRIGHVILNIFLKKVKQNYLSMCYVVCIGHSVCLGSLK